MYAPVNEKGMRGKMKLEKFWEDLVQVLKKFENVRRVFLLGDMNARVGNTEIVGVVGKYGVEGVDNTLWTSVLREGCSFRTPSFSTR